MVHTNSTPSHNHLTVEEAANGTIVKWVPLQDMVRLICDIVHPNLQRKYLQARDAAALKEYLSELDK